MIKKIFRFKTVAGLGRKISSMKREEDFTLYIGDDTRLIVVWFGLSLYNSMDEIPEKIYRVSDLLANGHDGDFKNFGTVPVEVAKKIFETFS